MYRHFLLLLLRSMNVGFRILAASSFEFGRSTFPEIINFSDTEQWQLVVNFLYAFRAFEGTYRAIHLFPHHPHRFLASYTSYISPEVYDNFFSDGPNTGDVQSALTYMKRDDTEKRDVKAGREIIQRLQPSNEEILAIIALKFWNIEDLVVRPAIATVADKYCNQIMKELHSYYREELKLEDYASRLGQLMSFIQIFRCSNMLKEHFEMLRLLKIFEDDTFMYTLQKN